METATDELVDQVAGWLRAARAVTVLTGAGVSTDSGIPDYRGPQGVWTRNPEAARAATLQDYVGDPEVRRRVWQTRRSSPAWTAQPNAAHVALVELERAGRLRALVTQNIDELHQRAGSDPTNVVELHGTIWHAECLTCGVRSPMLEVLERLDVTPDPSCELCGGILKSATISFGQALVPRVLERAYQAAEGCDIFLAVGSSLSVHPAAGLCDVATAAGARLVIVNGEPTPYDAAARRSDGAVIRARIGDVLPAMVARAVGVAPHG